MPNNNIIALDLNLDENYIKASVEDIVSGAIVNALGDPTALIKTAINRVINRRVNKRGEITDSNYESRPYMQWLAETTVEKTVRTCIENVVNERKETFVKEIEKQLLSTKFRGDIATAFLDTIIKSAKEHYKMPISVEFKKGDC